MNSRGILIILAAIVGPSLVIGWGWIPWLAAQLAVLIFIGSFVHGERKDSDHS